jgi:cytidylate kinase
MVTTPRVIAVDGPGGVGKTTVSRGVAERLGWDHLDTGAFYRAATVSVLIRQLPPTDAERVASAIAGAIFQYADGRMLLEDVDVSEAIRTDIVTRNVSAVAANSRVRRTLVELQRRWVEGRIGAVVEGRDIGTVVFTDAPLKIFLTARPEVRAARRAGETDLAAVEDIARDLARRDAVDSGREASPMEAADDAVIIDTSDLSQDEVVEAICRLAAERSLG